ncbi:hypothetical protein GPECTOR_39g387 [Gonium pectorale]|uniref:Uncharacterized protein n=1 Tax=Gonium pectorale TaxID=33097 RepID=A0A150GAU9_GONPE|nr:hypothetical protein GPECTOR_39g387 [Gonium pectorale]|eukprot:KXZ46893.1 hypothetical protein GPECTOR_39g387 [Gonium pectorale]
MQFEALKLDFTYNLDLLRQRDEELACYDEATAAQRAAEAALRGRVAELEALAGSLQAELQSARAAAEQQEFVLAAKRSELAGLLEEERLGRAEALLRTKEQAEAARRALQRDLEDARDQAEQQRRALHASFQQQLYEAQAAAAAEVAQLKQAAAASSQLAEQRLAELKQAAEREAQALQQAEASRATIRERDVTLRGLELELDSRAREHDATVRQLQQQAAEAQHKLRLAAESYEAHRTQLGAQLATAQACLEELRRQCLEDIGLLQRRHGEEMAAAETATLERQLAEVRAAAAAAVELAVQERDAAVSWGDKDGNSGCKKPAPAAARRYKGS